MPQTILRVERIDEVSIGQRVSDTHDEQYQIPLSGQTKQ